MHRSKLMLELYGDEGAEQVCKRLESLDSDLNQIVQTVAYDIFWRRDGFTLKEKSLVTILTLFALEKEEQLRIHLGGFFKSNGSLTEINHYLEVIENLISTDSLTTARKCIHEIAINRKVEFEAGEPVSPVDEVCARIIVLAAQGDVFALHRELSEYFELQGSETVLRDAFIHMIVYAGFPVAMNAFAVLKAVLDLNRHNEV